MPINTDLNIAPYFDDFDIEKQFYKILFKPAYAVQARELTQLQTILQNQIEQFGDNIYQEGSIVKGCNFTTINNLEFVKVKNVNGFDVESYISGPSTEIIGGIETEIDVIYELEAANGLKASIITAARGFETRPPDLNTFFINYLNTDSTGTGGTPQKFAAGQPLKINRYKYNGSVLYSTETALTLATDSSGNPITSIEVTLQSDPVGKSYGIQASPGVIFQNGHFLYTSEQTLVVSKYTDQPDDLSVGYEVSESLISSLQDPSLYDNANGSANENAPGADRLKMVPTLTVKSTAVADVDPKFFTLIRYQNGSAVVLRDVSQFNSIAEELAKRTYEESGNYVSKNFKVDLDRRDNELIALVGKGTAYVKGYRVENTGKVDFAIDNVSETTIQDNQATTVDYGSYVDIVDLSGLVDLNYGVADLQNASSTKIGEAIIRNITPTRLYLFGIKMNSGQSFANVTRVVSSSGVITIAANSRVKDLQKAPVIFETGTKYIKSTTDISIAVRDSVTVNVNSNTVAINADVGEDFAVNQDDVVVVDSSNTLIPVLSWSTSVDNTILTLNLDPAAAADPIKVIYFNKRIITSEPHSKNLVQPYVKINYSSATDRYSLGFPDVLEVVEIFDGDVATGTRYTDSFMLHTNQTDHYYGISYLEYIPGRPRPANGALTVKLKVFELNSAAGQHYFTINSYPIDDSATPAANTIRSTDLATYSATNSKIYNLRECFDFRPYAQKDSAVNYNDITFNSAEFVTSNVGDMPVFDQGLTYAVPALQSVVTSDIEHYLSRIDLIVANSYGELSLVKGEEDERPAAPKVSEDELAIAEITIPGYPALSPAEASESGKFASAIKIKPKGTKNYTMRDIEKIEKRIEGLEYYISLNQLEQSTENLLILDENGLTRFKNGYIVDPFNDTRIANVQDANHKSAIHFDKKILTPALNTFPLDLKYKSASSASVFPSVNDAEVASLSRNANVKLMGQPYATNFRNCVSNFWKYDGQAVLSPDHDMAHDTVQNPVPVELDITGLFQDLQEQIPITGVNWTNQVTSGRSWTQGRTTFTEQFQVGQIEQLVVNDGGTNQVGDFVTNVRFRPYMRSRDVAIYVSGLRPNTQHYFFFDGKDVNANVTPGTSVGNARSVQKLGRANDPVKTDANGVLRAVFTIPEATFFVGSRILTVVDVNQFSSIESASTSKAEIAYHAYNIEQEKTTISTRVPEFDTIDAGTTTRSLPARAVTRRGDPLAQTFFIKKGMGRGSNSIFASKIDLYFKRKSDTNGVTIMLREVINGYPASIILPFSKVHLTSSQVNVSDDATAVTEVFFDAPVRMDVEKEYAVVIMPDANDPNYLHFTSKVGGIDLTAGPTQGQPVVQDWGDGVLFTSTNNRAWQSVQDEDIKFTLYRHDFNASAGSVTLTNDDHEFFTLSDWDGRFAPGEYVYKVHATGYNISMVQGTNVITTSASDFNVDYAAGDYILVVSASGNNSDIFRIASVDSSTQMTTDKPCHFTGATTGTPIVAGIVSHYNRYNRAEMHLKKSSATLAKKFSAGDVLTGFTTGTQGTIGSVDNINLSYIQPLIQKANDSVTSTTLRGRFNDPSNTANNYDMPMKFGDNNAFTRKGVVLYSKSNNQVNAKPFEIIVDMANKSNSTSSPLVDLELATSLAYQYKVTNNPATTSKYISKTIELAEDLDAEDMQVILTGHRPNETDIKVYIRPQHAQDSASFDTIDWIELELFEGVNTYCSSTNLDDYREYKYRVAEANKDGLGVIQYTSDGGTFSGYRKFAIRIDMIANNIHDVPTVKDYRGIALT